MRRRGHRGCGHYLGRGRAPGLNRRNARVGAAVGVASETSGPGLLCPRVPFGYQPPWPTAPTSVGGLELRCASRREATRARSGPRTSTTIPPLERDASGLRVRHAVTPATAYGGSVHTAHIGGAMAESVR